MTSMSQASKQLQHVFGLSKFRPGQQQVITALLNGESALAVFPTGGGKSLCYQLPALLFNGLTLVVSPLIALMKDQVDHLQSLNIPADRFDSSLNGDEVQQLYQDLASGQIKILYVAPERLSNQGFIKRIQHLTISLLAIDEAHCISDWGHNFRPDYLKLASLTQQLSIERVLALTATATPAVSQDICQRFNIKPQHHIQTGFYRPNLSLHIKPQAEFQRQAYLLSCLQKAGEQPSIVYVTLQKTAEQIASLLDKAGLKAAAYHAGLKTELRNEVQNRFMADQLDIVVATIAFGMGIDKANIRAVYHYNLPKALENYMQEIGRAGRDGLPAHCELIAGAEDLVVLENFTYGDTPDRSALANIIHWIEGQDKDFSLSTYQLSQQYDVRPLVLNTLLTYLELDNMLKASSPFYSQYKIKSTQAFADICQYFDPQRAAFLQALFASGKQGSIWLTIDLAQCAQQLNQPEQRIINAINYLEHKQLAKIQVTGLRQGYKKCQPAPDGDALISDQQHRFEQREQRDISRLHQVVTWIESNECYNQALMRYFGEPLQAACGHCSYCSGEGKKQLVKANTKHIAQQEIQVMLQHSLSELNSPRKLARFLCGITSPNLTKAKLHRHPKFGLYAHRPFASVLACAEEIIK